MTPDDMMFKPDLMKGQRILITGGGTGLGKEMAEGCQMLGAEVYICGRRGGVLEEAAKELMNRHGGKVIPIACDIRVPEAIHDMMEEIWSGGALTGLVNNAAGNFISRTEDLSSRGFDAIADIVLHGTFYVTHAVGRRWIAQKLPGSVVSILVTWVHNGGPFVVPSAMSKAGVNVMTKSLAVEWGRHQIRLNAIAPGVFPTEGMSKRLYPGREDAGRKEGSSPMGRVGEMSELQNVAAFLMADGCEWLTGQTLTIDGANSLATGGNFYHFKDWSDEDWALARETIREQNDRDRLARTV
jgi:NAD(P)-dependent dehydrogenase (short-subunit alcohol dehydrogenase family)